MIGAIGYTTYETNGQDTRAQLALGVPNRILRAQFSVSLAKAL